ncbi:MAG: hypothetical protein R6W99_10905 [Clostridia bacterium]
MHWWYLLIGAAIIYFGYRMLINSRRVQPSKKPLCEKCGTPMELQSKVENTEVWECPKCRNEGDGNA